MDELEFEVGKTDTAARRSVRAPLTPRLRRPPRAVTVGLVVACVVLVMTGLALASVPNLPGSVNVLLHGTPTATPRIFPGGDLLYLERGLPFPWGQLRINGVLVAIDQYRTVDAPSPITLRRGVTTIVYHADPFPALRCRISVPTSKSDTCPLDAGYPFPSVPAGVLNYAARALDLRPTLDQLPSAARADLVRVVRSYVSVSSTLTTVQPGERYVNADHQIVYADQPLTATYTQTLAASASPTSNGCAVLCMPALDGVTNPAAPAPVADFVVDAHLSQSFSYATASGQPVATDAPISEDGAVPSDGVVALTVIWNGAWQVALNGGPQSSSVACLAGALALQPYIYDTRGQFQVYPIAAEIPAPNPVDGCVYRLGGGGAYAGPVTADEFLHVFYRFGVVMIVDNAHDVAWAESNYLLKDLPIADDAETALAQQLDATQPYN